MQTHDFFTRLVEQNTLGPNMIREASAEVETIYECAACGDEHGDEWDAQRCCRPPVYFKCPACDERYDTKDDARDCCGASGECQPRVCPVCVRPADTYRDAADCCLHTHPSMTGYGRQRVAEDVERGTPWADAIRAHASH